MEKNTLSFFFLENNNQIINGINKTIIKSYLIKKKKKTCYRKRKSISYVCFINALFNALF